MERLPKVEDFNCKFLADHDVGHLDVQVGNLIVFEVPQSLKDHEGEVDDGLLGSRGPEPPEVFFKVEAI